MPERLAFAAPLPAYVFQNVSFEAKVKLVDENNAIVTGVSKILQATLRYHDTYDVVQDQSSMIDVSDSITLNPESGSCSFLITFKAVSASWDCRSFCIEVRSVDSDVESVFSTPVFVVKEKLAIVEQPPDVWFKDEGGREKCMTVTLVLEPAPGAFVEDRVVPLQIRLLYESGNPVLNQSILRLFPDMRPNMSRGRVTISFRIDDVSKNHQGQSFVLEVAPEKQDSSTMFQDIAPARTSIIAIRSKRNKRKLNNSVVTAAGMPAVVSGGPRASPRSVAGTPRANMMMMQPQMMAGPSPSQRTRRGPVMMGTPNYMGHHPHHPSSGRTTDVTMPVGSGTWSSHVQPHPAHVATTPMHMHHNHHPPQQQQQPHVATNSSASALEWKLGGFEIHPDGTQNLSRPIYRCSHCKRWADLDMMSNGTADHSPQCMFAVNPSSMVYRSQMEGTPLHQRQQEIHMQQTLPMHQQQQQYRAVYHSQTSLPMIPTRASTVSTSVTHTHPVSAMSNSLPVDSTNNTVNVSVSSQAGSNQPYQNADNNAEPSPKALAAMMGTTQRPALTISPFMNKVTNGSDGAQTPEQNSSANPENNSSNSPTQGNLFASNAFSNQMDLVELANNPGAPHTTVSKLSYLNKQEEGDENNPANDQSESDRLLAQESPSTAFVVGTGSSLFNEMTSMGISLDQFDKADSENPLGDFSGISPYNTNEEDQVFYILAIMYSDAQSQKIGLPAFDQFQRMLGFYSESQNDAQTQVIFTPLHHVALSESEQTDITERFVQELSQNSDAVHSLPKYQHNLIMLREDALMYYWSQSLQNALA